jgi:hypothetical protein
VAQASGAAARAAEATLCATAEAQP